MLCNRNSLRSSPILNFFDFRNLEFVSRQKILHQKAKKYRSAKNKINAEHNFDFSSARGFFSYYGQLPRHDVTFAVRTLFSTCR